MSLPIALVVRLLSLFVEGESVTPYKGRLPSALAGLPLPAGTEVAVAYVRSEHEEDFLVGISLDTLLEPEAFITQFTDGLERNGWRVFREQFSPIRMLFELPGGDTFDVPEPVFHSLPYFARGDLTLWLGHPTTNPGRSTHVSLRVEKLPPPPQEEAISGRLLELLPVLTTPEGDVFSTGLVGGGDNHVTGEISVWTRRTAGALAEHFTAQLEASDWHVTERLLGEKAAAAVLERKDRRRTYDVRLSVFRSGDRYSKVKLEAALRTDE